MVIKMQSFLDYRNGLITKEEMLKGMTYFKKAVPTYKQRYGLLDIIMRQEKEKREE